MFVICHSATASRRHSAFSGACSVILFGFCFRLSPLFAALLICCDFCTLAWLPPGLRPRPLRKAPPSVTPPFPAGRLYARLNLFTVGLGAIAIAIAVAKSKIMRAKPGVPTLTPTAPETHKHTLTHTETHT